MTSFGYRYIDIIQMVIISSEIETVNHSNINAQSTTRQTRDHGKIKCSAMTRTLPENVKTYSAAGLSLTGQYNCITENDDSVIFLGLKTKEETTLLV